MWVKIILNSSVCYFCGDKYNHFLSKKQLGGITFNETTTFQEKQRMHPRSPPPLRHASAASASSASPCRPNHPRLEYKKSCLTFHNGRQPHRTYIEMKKLFALVFTCKGSNTKNTHQIFSKKNCIFPKKMLEMLTDALLVEK